MFKRKEKVSALFHMMLGYATIFSKRFPNAIVLIPH